MTEFEHDWICSVCLFDITCVSTFPTLFIYSLANIGVRIVWRIFIINYFYLWFDSIWLLSVWLSSCLRHVGLFYKTLQAKYPLDRILMSPGQHGILFQHLWNSTTFLTKLPYHANIGPILFALFCLVVMKKWSLSLSQLLKLEIAYSIYVTDSSSYQSYCFS